MSPGASKQPESKTNNWENLPIVFMCHGLDYVILSFILSLNKHLLSIQHAHTVFFFFLSDFKDDNNSVPAVETTNLYINIRERHE